MKEGERWTMCRKNYWRILFSVKHMETSTTTTTATTKKKWTYVWNAETHTKKEWQAFFLSRRDLTFKLWKHFNFIQMNRWKFTQNGCISPHFSIIFSLSFFFFWKRKRRRTHTLTIHRELITTYILHTQFDFSHMPRRVFGIRLLEMLKKKHKSRNQKKRTATDVYTHDVNVICAIFFLSLNARTG